MRSLLTALAIGMLLAMAYTRSSAEPAVTSAYTHTFEAIEGGQLRLEKYRGKVILVVNTASFCGFTPQYEGLQALWERYESKGFVVLGVPSNDFGGQEPKADSEILGFCKGAYNVTFPLTTKNRVIGSEAHPFYRWARETLGDAATPRWNFHKYLVGRDGKLIGAFVTRVEPLSSTLTQAIEAALGTP